MTLHPLRSVRLPGGDELALGRSVEGAFSWSVAGAPLDLDQVVERVRARLLECHAAIEVWDIWLARGVESSSPERQDELLDSRLLHTAERGFLEEFLAWAALQPEASSALEP